MEIGAPAHVARGGAHSAINARNYEKVTTTFKTREA
jgi:hypothetical protein